MRYSHRETKTERKGRSVRERAKERKRERARDKKQISRYSFGEAACVALR